MKHNKLGVSVIIACYCSEKVLEETLKCLQNQQFNRSIDWEVIVIDNNSSDNTFELARKAWTNSDIELHVLKEEKVGEANARKAGILHAQYSILSIVDDDNRVGPNWIETVFTYFENPEIGLVGTVGVGDFESPPPAWFREEQNSFAIGSLYSGDFVDITSSAIVPGAGLNVRKEIFDKLYAIDWRPFLAGRIGNIQSAGADSEICYITRLLGFKIFYSNVLTFRHFTLDSRITLERLRNMYAGFGASDVFTLPYRILYEEEVLGKSWMRSLRKKGWFNLYSKRIVSAFRKLKGGNSDLKTELLEIRSKAFCQVLSEKKDSFEGAFAYLNDIKTKVASL
ncbi:MAG: glycosyltransferase [Leadbetterella sp.]